MAWLPPLQQQQQLLFFAGKTTVTTNFLPRSSAATLPLSLLLVVVEAQFSIAIIGTLANPPNSLSLHSFVDISFMMLQTRSLSS